MSIHYVYKFIDVNCKVIYVGESNNLDRRIREHLSCNPNKTCFRRSDLKSISRIEYLKLNSKTEGKLTEKYYIREYLSPNLKNKSIPHKKIKIKNPPNDWKIYKVFRETNATKQQSKVKIEFTIWILRLLFWLLILYFISK